jgi:N4-gp56 family major capsid protein
MSRTYNDPAGGTPSDIGSQFNDFYYQKKALIELKKEQYFQQLADVTSMPKNFGKKIKKYHYLPLLDDANINDQGLDAAGLAVNQKVSIKITMSDGTVPNIPNHGRSAGNAVYVTGEGVTAAAAADAAILAVNEWAEAAVLGGGLGLTLVGGDNDLKFTDAVNSSDGLAYALGFRFDGLEAAAGVDALAVAESGNLYGSSKDVGTISAKLPALTENGGRVNRVGFKRIELEGTLDKFGFFDEYTQESLDFDTDSELRMHVNREMIMAANEMTEDALQIDLLNAAGIVRFGGSAISTAEISGESGEVSTITYDDLMRLSIDLDNNRANKNTTLISGSRMTDTRVVNSARYMYIGTELIPMVKKMVDNFTNQAFISVEKYAAAGGMAATGEIGQIDQFKIIVVPEMMHWQGAGKAVTTNTGYRESGGNYDVFPMLVVGSKSFTTIGFQTDGKTVKFKIKHAKPGSTESYAVDPYGETGFMSIKWYYGTMVLRPEHIALVKCVAEW